MEFKKGDIVESSATGHLAEIKRVSSNGSILVKYTTGRPRGTTHWVDEAAIRPRPDLQREK